MSTIITNEMVTVRTLTILKKFNLKTVEQVQEANYLKGLQGLVIPGYPRLVVTKRVLEEIASL